MASGELLRLVKRRQIARIILLFYYTDLEDKERIILETKPHDMNALRNTSMNDIIQIVIYT